jgi:hypothetical protein
MVYDTSRNFLGDTYWKEPNDVQEGDELTLDKGIMVEVAEAMGVTQTDLAPILERKKESPLRNNSAPMQRPVTRPAAPPTNALRPGSQLRHKSLNTLLGTPKGPIGKAAPMRSPFETRKEKENHGIEERAIKRQKTTHSHGEQPTSSAVASREPQPNKNLPLWVKTSEAEHVRALPRSLARPTAVITLDSEPDNIPSDVTLPSTPPRIVGPMSHSKATSIPGSNQGETAEALAITTPRIPKGRVPVPHVKAQETPRPPPEPSSPPISASNRLSNVDFALQLVRKPSTRIDAAAQKAQYRPSDSNLAAIPPIQEPYKEPSLSRSPPRNLKAKSLRLSKGVKRGILLCQSALPRKKTSIAPKQAPEPREVKNSDPPRDDVVHVISDDEDTQQYRQPKAARAMSGPQKKKRMSQPESVMIEPEPSSPLSQSSVASFDDMELIHGLMDQQLVVAPSPPRSREPTKMASTTENVPRTKPAAKKAPRKGKRAAEASPEKSPKTKKTKITTVKEGGAKPGAKRKQAEKPQQNQQDSSPAFPALDFTEQSRNMSAQPTVPVEKRPGTASASVSPSKLLALSTGGFRKKPKNSLQQPAETEFDAQIPRPISVALPPHPLRANKSGPLMSTTELSALLIKSTKSARLEDDPIEDSTQNISPSKGFQRSRSENDAPIPSMSEEWEQRNLPKACASNNSIMSTAKLDELPPAPKPRAGGLAALVKKTDPRRKFQRTQSLNVDANAPGIADAEVVIPPPDHDVGPWSTEAFDLFDWRPPNVEGGEQSNGPAGAVSS